MFQAPGKPLPSLVQPENTGVVEASGIKVYLWRGSRVLRMFGAAGKSFLLALLDLLVEKGSSSHFMSGFSARLIAFSPSPCAML